MPKAKRAGEKSQRLKRQIDKDGSIRKLIEVYCRYQPNPIFPKETDVVMSLEDLETLVKAAGLYLHRPDEGTEVVVIHRYKDRNDPRQYSKRKKR